MKANKGIKSIMTGTAAAQDIVSIAIGHFFYSAYSQRYVA